MLLTLCSSIIQKTKLLCILLNRYSSSADNFRLFTSCGTNSLQRQPGQLFSLRKNVDDIHYKKLVYSYKNILKLKNEILQAAIFDRYWWLLKLSTELQTTHQWHDCDKQIWRNIRDRPNQLPSRKSDWWWNVCCDKIRLVRMDVLGFEMCNRPWMWKHLRLAAVCDHFQKVKRELGPAYTYNATLRA